VMWAVSRGELEHKLALPRWLTVLGWLATVLMALAVALLLWSIAAGAS
jgi:hypothetical protein